MGKRSFTSLLHTKPQWKDKTQCSYDCPAKQTPSSQQPGVIFNFPCHGKFALPFCRLGHSYLYIWAQKDVVRLGKRLPESTPAGCQCAALSEGQPGRRSQLTPALEPPTKAKALLFWHNRQQQQQLCRRQGCPQLDSHTPALHAATRKVSAACKKSMQKF